MKESRREKLFNNLKFHNFIKTEEELNYLLIPVDYEDKLFTDIFSFWEFLKYYFDRSDIIHFLKISQSTYYTVNRYFSKIVGVNIGKELKQRIELFCNLLIRYKSYEER